MRKFWIEHLFLQIWCIISNWGKPIPCRSLTSRNEVITGLNRRGERGSVSPRRVFSVLENDPGAVESSELTRSSSFLSFFIPSSRRRIDHGSTPSRRQAARPTLVLMNSFLEVRAPRKRAKRFAPNEANLATEVWNSMDLASNVLARRESIRRMGRIDRTAWGDLARVGVEAAGKRRGRARRTKPIWRRKYGVPWTLRRTRLRAGVDSAAGPRGRDQAFRKISRNAPTLCGGFPV